jgi:aromatic-L-amino-acid/L-tryptophan decarboxylase
MHHNEASPIEDHSPQRPASLDLPEDVWREFAKQAQAFVTDYLTSVSDLPIFPQTTSSIAELKSNRLPEHGASIDEIMKECGAIRDASRHSGHPRFFGYVASSASPVGVIGDFVASALNQNLTAWRSSPGAVDIERTVVRWLGSLVGFGDDAGGLLTSGGSMANLNALYIAHRSKSPQVSIKGLWNDGAPMTIYASDQVHLSIAKAADVLGLGRQQVKLLKSDSRFRLDVQDLRAHLESDIAKGIRPLAVVASAGTVNTGAVDKLNDIALVAREHDLWFHIDGAYGALGVVDPSVRGLFTGIDLADSVSLDPHKWLYAPIDCGCLLLRDATRARNAFAQGEADYIKIYEDSEREAFAFWNYGIELTRRFRALKVWMIFRYYGARRISESIAEDISLAKYLGEQIIASEDFELLAPVELSICCFRYLPKKWRERKVNAGVEENTSIDLEIDRLNEKLMHTVQRGGCAYLSNAVLRGRFALRACVVNFRTTRTDMDLTLDIVRKAAEKLEEQL